MTDFAAILSDDPERVAPIIERLAQTAQTMLAFTVRQSQHTGATGFVIFSVGARENSGSMPSYSCNTHWCIGSGTWLDAANASSGTTLERLAAAHPAEARLASALRELDGTYCFIAGGDERLTVMTDPVGQLHVYCCETQGALLISTSALLLAQVSGAGWNMRAVREFLGTGTVFGDRALFDGVRKIGPGTILTCRTGHAPVHSRWWRAEHFMTVDRSPRRSIADFGDSIRDVMARVYHRYPDPALDLTGGYDSRILLAGIRNQRAPATIHTVVAGDRDDSDVRVAQSIADRFDLAHSRLPATFDDAETWWTMAQRTLPLIDGEYDMFAYANIMSIHQSLARSFDASVNGSGGELIRGYWWELCLPWVGRRRPLEARNVGARRFAVDDWAEPLFGSRFDDDLADQFAQTITNANAQLAGTRNTSQLDHVYLALRMQRWQGRLASATNRIWPCLSPLLFRQPMELALSAALRLRVNGGMARHVLAAMDRALADMPMSGGYPAVPITPRSLPRFTPLLSEYGKRAYRRLPGRRAAKPPANEGEALPPHPLMTTDLASWMTPDAMLTADLYDPDVLRTVCQAVRNAQESTAHAGRLVTLESIARLRAGA